MEALSSFAVILAAVILTAAAVTTIIQLFRNRSSSLRWMSLVAQENMPDKLAVLKPWKSEFNVYTKRPVKLKGRIDQALIDDKGEITLLDTKTRKVPRAYPSDVVQLSVYKICLERGMGKRVSPFGWIRAVHPVTQKTKYLRVKLLDESYIVNMYDRFWAIKRKKTPPICTCGGRFCGG